MNIVVTKIVRDFINQSPGIVTVTFFDSRGVKTQEQVITGGLFPADLEVGDNLVFVQRIKRDRYNAPIPLNPVR